MSDLSYFTPINIKKIYRDLKKYGRSTVTGKPFYCDVATLMVYGLSLEQAKEVVAYFERRGMCVKRPLFEPPQPIPVPLTEMNYVDEDVVLKHKEIMCNKAKWRQLLPNVNVNKLLKAFNCYDWLDISDPEFWRRNLPDAFDLDGFVNFLTNVFAIRFKRDSPYVVKIIDELMRGVVIYRIVDGDKVWYAKLVG